ncbi:MAG: iron donor protein CyaY [Planctomycetes bacterium]|nr:iron donor protein CyaY [Planctomycetota bacterium]
MSNDVEFTTAADRFMEDVFTVLTEFDPDELDPDLAMGVLSMEFADGSKCIMNRQTAAHQIWLANRATAWHFARDESGAWMDTKGRGELRSVLGEVLSQRLGRTVTL